MLNLNPLKKHKNTAFHRTLVALESFTENVWENFTHYTYGAINVQKGKMTTFQKQSDNIRKRREIKVGSEERRSYIIAKYINTNIVSKCI